MNSTPMDTINVPPALFGAHGRAWRVNLEAARQDPVKRARLAATLTVWVIERVGAHPACHSYVLMLAHLRPSTGATPVFHLPGATHEMILFAMDPRADRAAVIAGQERIALTVLDPPNFAAQFIAPEDASADKKVALAVRDVVDGRLNPTIEARHDWAERFGDNMLKDKKA